MLTLNDGRSELWQWDTGRTLKVDAECSQVHFSNKVFGRSIDVDVVDGVAIIPDIMLQTEKDLFAWAFVGTPENGYTKISKVFKVNRRNKPSDYVFTPPEQTTLAEIMERLDELEAIQDPDAIKNAVDDYLANNPIKVEETDPTVPEWAKKPNPPDVKIPDKLPNPHSLTFTGAVNASYDGSDPVEINIPGSGGNVDLTGYATEQYVQKYAQPKGEYLTEVPEDYAKTEDIPTKPEDIGAQPAGNYLTEVPSGYATEEFVKNKIAEAELGGEEVDLSGYAQKSELPTKVSELKNDAGYLTEHQDLSDYAKKTELPVVPVQSVNGKTGSVKLSASDVGARPSTWMPTASEVGARPSSWTPTASQVGADPAGTAANAVAAHNQSDAAHADIRESVRQLSELISDQQAQIDSDEYKEAIAEKVPIVKVAEQPTFVNDISKCTDTTKLYVLPDGFVYAYMQTVTIVPGETVANFTNLLKTPEAEIKNDMRYSHSNGVFKSNPGSDAIILPIPTSGNVTMRFRNCGVYVLGDGSSYASVYLGTDKTTFPTNAGIALANWLKDANGDYYFTFTNSTGDKYLTCTMLPFDDTAIITANEEIVYTESEGTETISYEWKNTGIAFVASGVTPGSGNVLYGKKLVACGDSFTAGSTSYPTYIANRNNMTLVNMAVSGSKLTNIADSSVTPFSAGRYLDVPADADYITLSFGLNEIADFNEMGDTLVGTKADTTTETIWGAYNTVFTHFLTQNPYVKIGVIISDAWMTNDYATVIREICTYWGIPYIDLKGDGVPLGIGGKYADTAKTAASLRDSAFKLSADNQHPNEKAHEYRSTFIENFMRSL